MSMSGRSELFPSKAAESMPRPPIPRVPAHKVSATPMPPRAHASPIVMKSQPARFLGWRDTMRLPVTHQSNARAAASTVPALNAVGCESVWAAICSWMC